MLPSKYHGNRPHHSVDKGWRLDLVPKGGLWLRLPPNNHIICVHGTDIVQLLWIQSELVLLRALLCPNLCPFCFLTTRWNQDGARIARPQTSVLNLWPNFHNLVEGYFHSCDHLDCQVYLDARCLLTGHQEVDLPATGVLATNLLLESERWRHYLPNPYLEEFKQVPNHI